MQYLDFKNLSSKDLQDSVKKYAKQFCEDIDYEQKVIDTVNHFLQSQTIRETKNAKSLRKEIQLQTSSDSNFFLRGFIDLLYTTEQDGETQYHIVDFKTASKLDEDFLNIRMENYKYQGASYVMALQEILNNENLGKNINKDPKITPKITMSFLFGNETGTKLKEMSEDYISKTIDEIKVSMR